MIDGASGWSKDRVREEIQSRRDRLASVEREYNQVREEWIAEGCPPQRPMWHYWTNQMGQLRTEINDLISLL